MVTPTGPIPVPRQPKPPSAEQELAPLPATDDSTTVGAYQGAYAIDEEVDGNLVAVQKTTDGALLVGDHRGTSLPRRIDLEDLTRAVAAGADAP